MSVVRVENLTVKFGDFTAVNDISFEVNKGEIFGFLGANGAGKTTVIRVICGLLRPTSGQVWINNESSSSDKIKLMTGYMSQRFTLYDDLTVDENLEFAATLRLMSKANFLERKKYLLEFIDLRKKTNELVRDLPGGIKQKVSLAASILHDPTVVFLDEPTAGVTPASRASFWSLIRKLSDQGKTVFVTSHYMDEVEQCDRIALMRAGEIVALGSSDSLKKQEFPNGMYALTSKGEKSNEQIRQLRNDPRVLSIQPHGLKYHIVAKNHDAILELQSELDTFFDIEKILPTMEDVFIKVISGAEHG